MTNRHCTTWRRAAATAALVLFTAVPALAADAVKINEFWIENVTVQSVSGDQIVYFTSTGSDAKASVEKLEGLRMAAYPLLAEAEQKITAKDFRGAATTLRQVRDSAKEPWLKQWLQFRLIDMYDRAAMPAEAVDAYLTLAKQQPLAFYLSKPPLASVENAKGRVAMAVRSSLVRAQDTVPAGAARESVKKMIELLPGEEDGGQQIDPPAAPTNNANGVIRGAPAAAAPQAPAAQAAPPVAVGNEAIVMANSLERGDPITAMLARGKFDEALQAVQAKLASKEQQPLSMRLYQRGLAQLALAQQSQDGQAAQKLYKDAGLSFMRVVVHFPRSAFAGACLMEAGLVHEKIQRPDLAKTLYDRARGAIDSEVEPQLAARLVSLIEALSARSAPASQDKASP